MVSCDANDIVVKDNNIIENGDTDSAVVEVILDETTPQDAGPGDPNPAMGVVQEIANFGIINEEVANYVVNKLGIESIDDLKLVSVNDLVDCGIKIVQAKKLMQIVADSTAATDAKVKSSASDGHLFGLVLPAIPTDESWLNSLKTTGILKVDTSTYIAAIHAAMADRVGLYKIPDTLVKKMSDYAETAKEPVGKEFFALRKELIRHNYAEIFEAIDGLDGTYITQARRDEFFRRVRKILIPAICNSFVAVKAWSESWNNNPGIMMGLMTRIASGDVPNPALVAPDTAPIRAASEALVDKINEVFAGYGVYVASALAVDAKNIIKTLENKDLPASIGAPSRELMLKEIGIDISSDYVRQEELVTRYVLGLIEVSKSNADIDSNYCMALWSIGNQINWSLLGANPSHNDLIPKL